MNSIWHFITSSCDVSPSKTRHWSSKGRKPMDVVERRSTRKAKVGSTRSADASPWWHLKDRTASQTGTQPSHLVLRHHVLTLNAPTWTLSQAYHVIAATWVLPTGQISIPRKVWARSRQNLDNASSTRNSVFFFFFEKNVFHKSLGFFKKAISGKENIRVTMVWITLENYFSPSASGRKVPVAQQSTQLSLKHLMLLSPIPLYMIVHIYFCQPMFL